MFLHLFLLLYSELTSSSFPSSSSALLCSQDQSSALLQFKQLFSFSEDASSGCDEVGHRSYPKMESWKDATDCCSWDGVTCDSARELPNLRELNLFGNSELTGIFPLSNWSDPLRFLDLSETAFSGELPKSIGNLKFLRQLVLNGCNFTGSVPASVGNLTQLTLLDISNNHFSGQIPSSLSNLRELSRLDLSNNNLSGKISSSLLVGYA